MSNERIAVLKGGDSSERDISLQTSNAAENALRRLGIEFQAYDITSFRQFVEVPLTSFTRVFLALHGGFGENGSIQAYLEGLEIPYNGASSQSSAICISKVFTKYVAQGIGVRVPKSIFCRENSSIYYKDISKHLGDRIMVKPDGEGCSIGIALVNNDQDFQKARIDAAAFGRGVLFEEFIDGQEITASFLNGEILPLVAIGFEQDFFSYKAKYESEETTSFWFPELDVDVRQEIECAVNSIEVAFGIFDYFRADFIIRDQIPYLLEVNTLPGLSLHSVFPRACLEASIKYDQMIRLLNGNDSQE